MSEKLKAQMHMIDDVKENAKRISSFVRNQITEYAEQNAEVYVSSTLAIEDLEEKQRVKNEYIELFEIKILNYL